jgi:cytochrome b involved in lipid metabolism
MRDKIETNLHPRDYTYNEVFRIINPKQVRLYIKNKVYPIDMYASIDDRGNDVIVYVFLREETKDLYQAWLAHELE